MRNYYYFFLFSFFFCSNVWGITNGDISLTLLSGNQLFTDQNNCSVDGPKATYLQVKVTNLTAVQQTNLTITLTSFSDPVNFGLAGGQVATQFIDKLNAGATDTLYWFIRYPPCTSVPTSTISFQVKDLDDNTVATDLLKNPNNTNATLVVGGLISANVTGQSSPIVVTRNDIVVGGIISFKARYDFNTVSTGGQIWFQPAGNLSFNAGAFQLVQARICDYISPDLVPCMLPQGSPLNYICKMNYIASCNNNGNSNKYFYVEYDFRINENTTTYAAPHATGLSGNPYKYTYDVGYGVTLDTQLPLPVSMSSFTANSHENGALLTWTTENETNNQKFFIEREIQSEGYHNIAEIAAIGNSTQKNTYQYLDESMSSSACYRIVSQDINGNIFTHNAKCVEFKATGLKLLFLYPIPASEQLNISFIPSFNSDEISINVFDVQGNLVEKQVIPAKIGINEAIISLTKYASGFYFVKINDGINASVMYKFAKE